MAKEIKTVIIRSSDTIIADAIGATALLVMLFVGLSLPGMVLPAQRLQRLIHQLALSHLAN